MPLFEREPIAGSLRDVTPLGTKLCRPNSEAVLEILPVPAIPAFTKKDGEPVIDTGMRRAP